MTAGRPTDYTPKVIEELNRYLRDATPENMAIPTVEGFALRMGITKKTLYNWAKKHKEFLHALGKLKMTQKEALITTGIFGGKEINQTIVALLLKVNHKMIETTKTDVTVRSPKPLLDAVHNNNSSQTTEQTTEEN